MPIIQLIELQQQILIMLSKVTLLFEIHIHRHMHAITKYKELWKKANRPKTAEIIQSHLDHTLSLPGVN